MFNSLGVVSFEGCDVVFAEDVEESEVGVLDYLFAKKVVCANMWL